jgi:triosephosphate isomerase
VVAITGVAVTPTSTDTADATLQFQSMPIVTLGTPSGSSRACGVAIEPIDANGIGKVAVAGAVQVKKADLHKLTDKTVLWEDSNWALVVLQGASIRLGTIAATWTKGNSATVTMQSGDGAAVSPAVTFTAQNYFATVTVASGTRRVACARIDNTWVLIAAECA